MISWIIAWLWSKLMVLTGASGAKEQFQLFYYATSVLLLIGMALTGSWDIFLLYGITFTAGVSLLRYDQKKRKEEK